MPWHDKYKSWMKNSTWAFTDLLKVLSGKSSISKEGHIYMALLNDASPDNC